MAHPQKIPLQDHAFSLPEDAALAELLPLRHIGVDEAGRGCLAGPVVAGAVFFPQGFDFGLLPGLADSKKLSEKERGALAGSIMHQAPAYGVGFAWQDEIDRVNILNATMRAMCRAVLALTARLQELEGADCTLPPMIIDGNRVIPESAWDECAKGAPPGMLAWEQYLPLPATRLPLRFPTLPQQLAVVRGDARVPAVSAASILAKTARDGLMQRMDEFYPGYGLAGHKGYGTKEHLNAIARKGPCLLHRLTFKGVKSLPPKEPDQARLL